MGESGQPHCVRAHISRQVCGTPGASRSPDFMGPMWQAAQLPAQLPVQIQLLQMGQKMDSKFPVSTACSPTDFTQKYPQNYHLFATKCFSIRLHHLGRAREAGMGKPAFTCPTPALQGPAPLTHTTLKTNPGVSVRPWLFLTTLVIITQLFFPFHIKPHKSSGPFWVMLKMWRPRA